MLLAPNTEPGRQAVERGGQLVQADHRLAGAEEGAGKGLHPADVDLAPALGHGGREMHATRDLFRGSVWRNFSDVHDQAQEIFQLQKPIRKECIHLPKKCFTKDPFKLDIGEPISFQVGGNVARNVLNENVFMSYCWLFIMIL